MNFEFSDDQKQLRDQARRFLAEKCPPKAVRAVLEGHAGAVNEAATDDPVARFDLNTRDDIARGLMLTDDHRS